MENQMQIFNNEQFGDVRTVLRDGESWFVAVDVCKARRSRTAATLFPGWLMMRRIP